MRGCVLTLYVVEEVDGACRGDDGGGCVRSATSVIASVMARW
jgi:hypothetical protein